jgi:hypothetical protein
MPRYRLTTLIDITRTDAGKTNPDELKVKQQQNFNSLRQAIELRANVQWTRDPIIKDGRLPDDIEGKAKHWIWEFEVERDELFLEDGDPVALLKKDLHRVPIISGLNNSVDITPACFFSSGERQNIWITEIS